MKPRQCKACGALIVFVRTPNGKAMPCDAAKVYYKEDGGRDLVVTDAGQLRGGTITSDCKSADGFAYRPHWASCLGADKAAIPEGGNAARLPQGRGLTCWGQKEYSKAARMGKGDICPIPPF